MCFLAGAQGSRHWLLASNSDNPYATLNHLIAAAGEPHPYLAVRVVVPADQAPVPWAGMLTRGVNHAGLAFTYAFVLQQNMGDHPAQDWTAKMLATADSVEDALACIPPRSALPGNYFIADRAGDMAIAEVGNGRVHVHRPEGPRASCTNLWQRLDAQPEASWDAATWSSVRHSRGHAAMGSLDTARVADLAEVLCDHQGETGGAHRRGESLCNHGREDGTISSEILDPAGHLWFAHGAPCGTRRGHEQDWRTPWGRMVRFSVQPDREGALTTPAGDITALGVTLMTDSSGAGSAAHAGGEECERASVNGL
jgi:hypothetical protein